jgi:hypothetical protein
MSALTYIPNMNATKPQKSVQTRLTGHRVRLAVANRLEMSEQQLQFLLLSVGLLSIGTMLLTYPM